MAVADEVFRPDSTLYGTPPVDVAPIYKPTGEYVVTGLMQTDRIRPRDGKLIPTIQVSFQVPGSPGNFTILIDNYAFTHVDVLEYMRARSYTIRQLYAIPDQLPPYVPLGGYATGVPLYLDTAKEALQPDGTKAIAWTGRVNNRDTDATVLFEITELGGIEPTLVSDPVDAPASDLLVNVSGTTGPVDPGKYTVQLTAKSGLGLGLSSELVVTVL